ncbi:MAG: phage major capsid protein, partial [Clostridia bacterium]|nr:phage major capsid protein [Clostridia bacterium]
FRYALEESRRRNAGKHARKRLSADTPQDEEPEKHTHITDQLFGYPILISNAMPNPESGNKAIAFGDFNCFWIGDRGHHHLKRLNELKATTDQVEFVLTKRVDAKLVTPEAIKTLQIA